MKDKWIIIGLLAMLCVGCPFSRPRPTDAEYIKWCLNGVLTNDIHSLKFNYDGAVGGYTTSARIHATSAGIKYILANARQLPDYVPANNAEETDEQMACRLEMGHAPAWLKLPQDKVLKVYEQNLSATAEHPGRWWKWYLDQGQGVLYFIGGGD